MERIHAYKKLPEYGTGVMGNITFYDLSKFLDQFGGDVFRNADDTEAEIAKEDLQTAIDYLEDETQEVEISKAFTEHGWNRDDIRDALKTLLDEADQSEDYVALTIF